MGSEIILETEDLTKEFAGFIAVNGVSLRVKRRTVHALIGPNGAGKTTCFNMLTKFLRPTRGRIVFNGNDITALQPADVARLGLVRSFQISAVFPHLTVLENVRVALQRLRGNAFDFWRSASVLDQYNEQARDLIAEGRARDGAQRRPRRRAHLDQPLLPDQLHEIAALPHRRGHGRAAPPFRSRRRHPQPGARQPTR